MYFKSVISTLQDVQSLLSKACFVFKFLIKMEKRSLKETLISIDVIFKRRKL